MKSIDRLQSREFAVHMVCDVEIRKVFCQFMSTQVYRTNMYQGLQFKTYLCIHLLKPKYVSSEISKVSSFLKIECSLVRSPTVTRQ